MTPIDLRVFLPQSAEDVFAVADDIIKCLSVAGNGPLDPEIIPYLSRYPHTVYLFYDADKVMAFIRLDDRGNDPELGKNTVEIHGTILPEYRGHADEPAYMVMTAAFEKKKTIIAKVDPNNLGAVGFCRKWGFTKINREHGLDVYRLRRTEFMEQQR